MTRILIVDDKPENLYMLRALLAGHGHEVDEARQGAEALAKARQSPPDLIISDLLMPVMDGYTLLRHWKTDERLKQIPFIVYTATYTEPRDEQLALDLGADAFIIKPTEPEPFMARIQEVLAKQKSGALSPVKFPRGKEEVQLRQYNKVLIRRLEIKMEEVQQANRELERELAERKAHEREIQRLNHLYAILSGINHSITRIKSREELFQEICRIATEHVAFKVVWIGWRDAETRQVVPVSRAGDSEGYLDKVKVYADDRPEGRGPVGTCIREDKTSVFNDFQNDPRALPWHEAAIAHGLRAAAAVPIRFHGDACGAFTVYASEPDVFQDKEIALLEEAAGDISFALENLEREAQRQQAEEDVRKLNAELERRVQERTAKLEELNQELGAFSYSVSHDLRAPLRTINGFASILAEDYAPRLDEKGHRLLGTICGEVNRMDKMIGELLEFSKLGRQSMHMGEMDMTALAQSAFDQCAAQAPGRDIQFKLHPLSTTRGDEAMFSHVWGNLISNAIKYTRTKPMAEIEITGRADDSGGIVYCVKDNGVGFDMKYVERLFGVFQRLHSEADFEGTGVGLALAQRIVQRHGGRIWAKSTLNKGATFFFTLPAEKK